MTWESFWQTIVDFFSTNVWNIVTFFSVLVIGFIVIKIIMMVVRRVMRARKVDEMAIRFAAAILRFALWLLLILILLSILGVPVNGITTAFSAAVLSIGVALKDFLSNVASGIILIGSRKYKTGDYIQVSGVEGSVIDINFLFTTLKTPNSTQVTLPNSTMVNSPVTNLGAYPIRRIAITFTVAYESDTKLVRETLLHVMNSCPLVLEDPAPACNLKNLGESSIDFFCTCFCDNADYWNTYYYIMDHGFDECKRQGIVFPFKQIELTNKQPVPMPIAYPKGLEDAPKKTRKKGKEKLTMDDWEDLSFLEMTVKLKEQAAYEKKTREEEKQRKEASKKNASSKKK